MLVDGTGGGADSSTLNNGVEVIDGGNDHQRGHHRGGDRPGPRRQPRRGPATTTTASGSPGRVPRSRPAAGRWSWKAPVAAGLPLWAITGFRLPEAELSPAAAPQPRYAWSGVGANTSGGSNRGVVVANNSAKITSGGGAIEVIGTAGTDRRVTPSDSQAAARSSARWELPPSPSRPIRWTCFHHLGQCRRQRGRPAAPHRRNTGRPGRRRRADRQPAHARPDRRRTRQRHRRDAHDRRRRQRRDDRQRGDLAAGRHRTWN